jgi:hypothetical protein
MTRRDAQPSPDPGGAVHSVYKKTVKTTSESQRMGHQRAIVEGYRAVKR